MGQSLDIMPFFVAEKWRGEM